MLTLGDRLRNLRIESEHTQKEISDIMGISSSRYNQYEKNKRAPDYTTLKMIADFYHVSIDYLLSNTNVRTLQITQGEENNPDEKDERDIEVILERTRIELSEMRGLMFDGEPASDEAIQSVLDAMRLGIALAKEKNKKFTPKKYRK